MKSVEYDLEIYEPGSADDLWVAFSSDRPFASINKGDIVNPGMWPDSKSPMKVLRVVNVEHGIWETDKGITHKLMVFTEEVEGTRELR
ncbi:MAG: hypothetical protein GTN65_06005, partial [Armatimonadetes bacterium]|nr:hypothetical protein [Armatimonadota bacterium]NIO96644.1 hypothetical protein [Armatimonadota bacterium]NIT30796.1 hypothetical protein [Armatimonadota bacterium]